MRSKRKKMKAKTDTILAVSKVLALLAAIGYSITWGSQLLTLVSSFINPEWAQRTYQVDLNLFSIREHSVWYYVYAMSMTIAVSVLKSIIWYVVYDLLSKITLQSPFSIKVERKLETIAYLLFFVWIIGSVFWKIYLHYLTQDTGVVLTANTSEDEYLFMAGMIYIVSQIFKRGIEIQEENELTV